MSDENDEICKRVLKAFDEGVRARPELLRKIKKRRSANVRILWVLLKAAVRYKDMRFGQLLAMLRIDGPSFYDESVDLADRAEKWYSDIVNHRSQG
jgi:hypothetical protein